MFSKKAGWSRNRTMLVSMAAPFMIITFIFYYIPLFGWVYVFFDYKPGIPLGNTPYVGLKFFELALGPGSDLYKVLKNTFVLSFLALLTAPLPVMLAIMLSELKNHRFKKLVQTTTTLPYFISWIIVFSLAFSMFSIDGLVNRILGMLNISDAPLNVLGNNAGAWYIQTAFHLWKTIGFNAIIYLAAISGIDLEQFDAARVDGANRLQTIWHITVPGIMPTFIVLLLLSVSNLLSNGFEQFFVFYNPLVADKLNVLDYYIYRVGILQGDYAYATTIGVFKTIVSLALLFTINQIAKKVRGEAIV
ncbi:ABC transporter permease subunit [Paenibacillus cymbidii]|uniref:ABC transporter permease subunit n=1 Tax=Paenibacillus cymbidii TaxID=1639034 RepID=UPI00108151C1|nr:ABC transporter permease subunit [Paenibacillus cymbidii]